MVQRLPCEALHRQLQFDDHFDYFVTLDKFSAKLTEALRSTLAQARTTQGSCDSVKSLVYERICFEAIFDREAMATRRIHGVQFVTGVEHTI